MLFRPSVDLPTAYLCPLARKPIPRRFVESKIVYMLSMNLEITETIFLSTEKDKPSQNLCLALDIWIFLYQYFQEVKRCVKAKKEIFTRLDLVKHRY